MYYYKYCKPSQLHFGMLSRGEIFFASAEELNDGSECRPRYVLNGSAELWRRLAELILVEAWITQGDAPSATNVNSRTFAAIAEALGASLRRQAGRKDLDFDQLLPLLDRALPALLETANFPLSVSVLTDLVKRFVGGRLPQLLHERKYMACFSRDPRSPTMWGHYGDAERGFCAVFRASGNRLPVSSPAKILLGSRSAGKSGIITVGHFHDAEVELQSVIYRSRPPRVNAFHRLIPHFHYSEVEEHYDVPLNIGRDAPDRQEDLFGRVKASTWEYEQEVRAFLPVIDDLTQEARCLHVDGRCIQGLIFGPKMSDADKNRAIIACHLLSKSNPDSRHESAPFLFLDAHQRVDSFRMALVPIGVRGNFYSHDLVPFTAISSLGQEMAENITRTVSNMLGAN